MGFIYYCGASQTFSLVRGVRFFKTKKNILRIPILFVYYSTRARFFRPSNERNTFGNGRQNGIRLTGSYVWKYMYFSTSARYTPAWLWVGWGNARDVLPRQQTRAKGMCVVRFILFYVCVCFFFFKAGHEIEHINKTRRNTAEMIRDDVPRMNIRTVRWRVY